MDTVCELINFDRRFCIYIYTCIYIYIYISGGHRLIFLINLD